MCHQIVVSKAEKFKCIRAIFKNIDHMQKYIDFSIQPIQRPTELQSA